MTHPIFRQDLYIETPFEIRFHAMLRYAWHKRSWHVIVADPGSGKTVGIRDMIKAAGSRTVLAVVAPKNTEDEQALGDQFLTALGIPLRGNWRTRKPKLMGYLHQYGTECLVVDDAHDLSLEHLMFLKELTDQGHLQYDHPFGVCLVAAGRGKTIPLKKFFDQPDTTWQQFFRRLDALEPYCRIEGHTSDEVREILAALEKVYAPALPQLNLRRWAGSIYTWLTQSVLDPTNSGRVTMNYLMKLEKAALEWSYEAQSPDVLVEMLEKAATLLVLRRDTLRIIDGAGPRLDVFQAPPENSEQRSKTEQETKREQEVVQENVQAEQREQAEEEEPSPTTANCAFSGKLVPIDLKRFTDSGIHLVQCPDCGRMRSLSPSKGVLRFKAHTPRKKPTPQTSKRWSATGKTDWDVVGG
ncbi:MAG TPA: ATP-binding protein [Ktedonobacteraceae bacterium]|nr:ATP-binding protein [Ktedonobacteraceae bacterium]